MSQQNLQPTAMNAPVNPEIVQQMLDKAKEIEERKRALENLKTENPLLAAMPQIGLPVALATKVLATQPLPEDEEKVRHISMLKNKIKTCIKDKVEAQNQLCAKPSPLLLNKDGLAIDERGLPMVMVPKVQHTLKANLRGVKGDDKKFKAPPVEATPKFYDERIGSKPAERNKRQLRFHEPGKFLELGERMRKQQKLNKLQEEISQIARKTGINTATKLALIAPSSKQETQEDIPHMEWWDSVILTHDLDTLDEEGNISLRESVITNLIEHPAQIKPPNEPFRPVLAPICLTKTERKKLRRQQRRERWQEEQEMVCLGLAPPPEPKLRISNFMRILGQEAVHDPSKIEAHVREQMAKRQQAHLDANEARKLTPAQKSAKKIRKLKEDTSCGVHVSVYRILELQTLPSKKFKVETNARQLVMTGVVVLFSKCCVVVVEGGPKQQQKYKHLLQSRIKWEEDLAEGDNGQPVPNSCVLVWQGISQRRQFKELQFKVFNSERMVREYFQSHKVEHYWNAAYCGAILEENADDLGI